MSKKENPVPSIDKLVDKLWEDKYQYENFDRRPKDIFYNFAKDLLNGVETNNEKPIIHKCTCCGKQYAQTKVCYCKE